MKNFRLMTFTFCSLFVLQSNAAINYGKFLVSSDVVFDGKSLKADGYNIDNNKKTAQKQTTQSSSYIHWGEDKPEEEEITYLTEAKLEKGSAGFRSGKIQTSAWYRDGKLRSTTKCRNLGEKKSDKEDLQINCVTASSQACANLLVVYDEQLKSASLETLKKEINQCTSLLKNYADLAYAFSRSQNDDARNKVIESDMKRIEDASANASGKWKWNVLGKNVYSKNLTGPQELVDEMAKSSKDAANHIQSIQDAVELCKDNKENFRATGYKPINPKKKTSSGTDNG